MSGCSVIGVDASANMRNLAHDYVGSDRFIAVSPDGVAVAMLLRSEFHVAAEGEPEKLRVPNMADAGAYWMSLRPRSN